MNKGRIHSLDAVRGVAILIMIFVDAPPDIAYPLFVHAPWEGITLADFAFPGFIFAMGVSAAVSMSRREPSTRKIFRRAMFLFALGILFNTLPMIFRLIFWQDYTVANFFDAAVGHLRVFGILQRLAVTYALGILLARAIRNDVGIVAAAFVLMILSSVGYHVYAPENPFDPYHNLELALDLAILGENHMYSPLFEPEGFWGTLGATASFLLGFFAGKIVIDNAPIRQKILLLCVTGVVLLIAGELWTAFDMVNKKLWTAPYALITSGVEFFLMAICVQFLDTRPTLTKFSRPLCAVGMNPLFLFMFIGTALIFLTTLPSPEQGTSFYVWFYRRTFMHLVSPEFGSMIFCVLWCVLWLPLAEFFYRRGIIIKL